VEKKESWYDWWFIAKYIPTARHRNAACFAMACKKGSVRHPRHGRRGQKRGSVLPRTIFWREWNPKRMLNSHPAFLTQLCAVRGVCEAGACDALGLVAGRRTPCRPLWSTGCGRPGPFAYGSVLCPHSVAFLLHPYRLPSHQSRS
jgi:hypothetical protein